MPRSRNPSVNEIGRLRPPKFPLWLAQPAMRQWHVPVDLATAQLPQQVSFPQSAQLRQRSLLLGQFPPTVLVVPQPRAWTLFRALSEASIIRLRLSSRPP